MAPLCLAAPAALAAPLGPLGHAVLAAPVRALNATGLAGNQDQDFDFHGFGNDDDDSGEDFGNE